ncbi:MAG: GNAT family N-acetyltransferase [Deltaproteobacteria bacterium]|nr:GNAT family N-acetyltransferase [Deltaproteobacteria bacterium]MBW1845968.1 GNAT family N-acetyltransferase [Deltaproteobacteria bacterium]MBW2179232.1 GNAT family N-acetyltransferase [Deltaproteobacteria bacterium]MBW2364608.1 GNAT family N-acetyltransferase [Deltaproteobacteria bacterium]
MFNRSEPTWKSLIVSPDKAFADLEPGMNIFLGTGPGEPRTLVKHLMASNAGNLRDLTLIQLVSLGDAISLHELTSQKYRLKTFFSGWVGSEEIKEGRVDLIPSRFAKIPELIESKRIPIDVALVQITPPNEAGYSSLGIAVDVARLAMEQASLVIGEINTQIPFTYGDTFIPVSDFDFLIQSTDDPIYFPRWTVDDVFDKVAENVASIIEDGSCIAFTLGPLFEALSKHLIKKRHLGVHSPFFTDPLMDIVKSGAVTNRRKGSYRGKSLASYAFGTPELMKWLDRNPMVEFAGIDKIFNPLEISRNPQFICILPARKADLYGRIAFHTGKGNISAGPVEAADFLSGAELSPGGITVFALPSRNLKKEPNVRLSLDGFPNHSSLRESIDMIITEYGIANIASRTVRERAQAMIEIAHPDDRQALFDQAKKEKILYEDQIFLQESTHLYPSEVSTKQTFKNNTALRFRAIKPSDEEEMRRLFYRFSDESVYYRYFSPIKTMPHAKMQEYVCTDYSKAMSIVGLIGDPGSGHIIAEARYVKERSASLEADVAFVVDEEYQGLGIATYLYKMLIRLAKERGVKIFTSDVLSSNSSMMKVFEKGEMPFKARLEGGIYHLIIQLDKSPADV